MAILLIASLLLVAAGAALQGAEAFGRMGTRGGKAFNVDEIYATIAITGPKDGSTGFDILATAIRGKDGNVTAMSNPQPITGTYYMSNDTAVIPLRPMNKTARPKPVRTDYNKATISPAGGSAVFAAKNVTRKGGETLFTGVTIYLPDGSAKSYTLATPVKISVSRQTKTISIVASPELRADAQDALKGGARFAANAPPVPLKTIDAAK